MLGLTFMTASFPPIKQTSPRPDAEGAFVRSDRSMADPGTIRGPIPGGVVTGFTRSRGRN